MPHLAVRCDCGETLCVKREHAGRSGVCKGCLTPISIPSADVIARHVGREVSLGDLSTLGIDSVEPAQAQSVPSAVEESDNASTGLWKLGQVVDERYEVQTLLGQGAYGAVWKIHHNQWNLDLAVKELRPDRKMTRQRRANFVREAQTWVDDIGMHPHVVTAWYVRELEEIPYLFLEYCDGGDLGSWIRDGRTRDLQTVLDIAIQLGWGLVHCHEKGIVHRDFKPDNVMMTTGGMAKITDFGLVKLSVLDDDAEDNTGDSDGRQQTISAGRMLGTPSYMPPEQWVPSGEVDHRADIYALGVTIYELLTGQQPIHLPIRSGFPNQRIWLDACREAHEGDQPSLLIDKRDDVPAELERLVQACLAKQADDRPADVSTVVQSLLQIYESAHGESHGRPTPGEIQPLADGLNNQGVSLVDMRKANEAERRFEAALESDPQHPEATYNLGLLRWRHGEVTDVRLVEQLRAVSVSQPGQRRADYMLAQIYIERADYQNALELLESIEGSSEIRRLQTELRGMSLAERCGECLRTFEGHTGAIESVSFSSNGRYALSGSHDKTLKLWDVKSGECLRTFEGHTLQVTSVSISTDGRYALSGSHDKTLKLWDVKSGECLRTFEGNTSWVESVSFSADGRYALSVSSDRTLKLWDVKSGQCLQTFGRHTSSSASASFSADGRYVLSGGGDETLKLWDVKSGQCRRTFEGHTKAITSVSFSADGRYVLSGSGDETLKLWDVKSGQCLRTFEGHALHVTSVSISTDGRYALSGSHDKTLKLWDVKSGQCLRTFEGHTIWIKSVSFSSDGCYALSGSWDKTLKLWQIGRPGNKRAAFQLAAVSDSQTLLQSEADVDSRLRHAELAVNDGEFGQAATHLHYARSVASSARRPKLLKLWTDLYTQLPRTGLRGGWYLRTFEAHSSSIYSVSFSADGRYALSGSGDNTVKLWAVKSGSCLRTFKGHTETVTSVSFSADGRYALSGSEDNTVKLWAVEGGSCLRTFKGHTIKVTSVSFSTDSRYALSGSEDNTVKLWVVKSGQCLRTFEGNTSRVNSVSFSADGRYALSGSEDNTLKLWAIKSGRCLRTFKGHTASVTSVSFSADGRCALSGSTDSTLKLWDAKSGECLRTFEGHTGLVCSVSFSADSRYALSGSHDKTLKLWDVQSGECLRTFEGHTLWVTSVSFSADGHYALSGSGDNTVKLWFLDWELENCEPSDWAAAAQPWLHNFLTLHTPHRAQLPQDREPTDGEIRRALTRQGKPKITKKDFEQLLHTLGCAGFGWLRPEGVKAKLLEMAADWNGLPPLGGK